MQCAVPCFGAYQYYYTDALTSINTAKWTKNGIGVGNQHRTDGTTTASGSLIHKDVVPDAANEYEVKTTLRLKNPGGFYVHYLVATSDARLGPTSAGTFVAVEMNPITVTTSACQMNIAIKKAGERRYYHVAYGCGGMQRSDERTVGRRAHARRGVRFRQ